MRTLDKRCNFCVADSEDGGTIGVLHRTQLETHLPHLVKLAAIRSQRRRVILVSQLYHLSLHAVIYL